MGHSAERHQAPKRMGMKNRGKYRTVPFGRARSLAGIPLPTVRNSNEIAA
jgi:hypothetical protein